MTRRPAGTRGGVRRFVVCPRVRRTCRRTLPLLVASEMLPGDRTCLHRLEPGDAGARQNARDRDGIHTWRRWAGARKRRPVTVLRKVWWVRGLAQLDGFCAAQ